MTTSSNSYAAKAYSEHPIATWPLDDDVSFISLISDTNRQFRNVSDTADNWTLTGCTGSNSPTLPDLPSPFSSDIYSSLSVTAASDDTTIEAVSPAIFTFDQINQEMATFAINLYMYQSSADVNWYEIGYSYYDDILSTTKEVIERIAAPSIRSWVNLGRSWIVDEFDADDCHLIVRANVNTGSHTFIMHGLSVGQWSEPTSSVSLGATVGVLPSPLSGNGVDAEQYGILSGNGYYVVEDNRLLSVNRGVPMVLGSDNCTKIYPSPTSGPSFIFPGKGMMSDEGRYKEYTLEFWLKIKPNTKAYRRIVGPLSSDFGIYVSEGFMTLLVGNNFSSHNVSEWYRPMLVHVKIKKDAVVMLVNGEPVAEVEMDRSTIDYPTGMDFWGFYSYSDIELCDIDCVSVYPYIVPDLVAKKRFVWGQGVGGAEFVDLAFSGSTVAVDFPYTGYSTNRIYPDIERWDAGNSDNITASRTSISVPDYKLPTVYLGGRDIQEWYTDTHYVNTLEYPAQEEPYFITFRPNVGAGPAWSATGTNWTEECYLNFPSINFLNEPVASVYGVFESFGSILSSRPLMKFVNSVTGKVFEVSMYDDEVRYIFDGDTILTDIVDTAEHFVAGFHIPTMSASYGYEIATFFSTPALIQMYVGGDGTTTFEGKIYRIGFTNSSNYIQISDHFDATGIAVSSDSALMTAHYASYALTPLYRFNRFFLDISTYGIWEEYFPLSYFGSYVSDRYGNSYYDLDYMQINIGYPSVVDRNEVSIVNMGWTYSELFELYNSPEQRTYETLDNELITHYTEYADLNTDTETVTQIATDRSSMDSYITFQLMAEGADEPLVNFSYSKDLDTSYVIYAGDENTSLEPFRAYLTKFAFVDNTVIYPPKNINFNQVAMVVHLVFNQEGILSMPTRISNLEITSRAISDNTFTPIGTKFGIPMYPYLKSGVYYDKKSRNPVAVYKRNTPYLYLTEKSGVKSMTYSSDAAEYGLAIPVNQSKAQNSKIAALNVWAKYDMVSFPVVPAPVFELRHLEGTVEFLVEVDGTGQRGIITARDKDTRVNFTSLAFYQNGIMVKNPVVGINDWNVIGVVFDDPLDFTAYAGSINLFAGFLFNCVSSYKPEGLGETASIIPRPWSLVLNDPDISGSDLTWQYWYDRGTGDVQNWKSVYVFSENKESTLTPSDIYQAYMGTNRIVFDDDAGFEVTNDDFAVLADTTWLRYSGRTV